MVDPSQPTLLTKRFVVEDSITKVTSDGEPHEMMTMIAVLSGLVAAIFILSIVVALVVCKKKRSGQQCCKQCATPSDASISVDPRRHCTNRQSVATTDSGRSSLSTIYTRTESIPESPGIDAAPTRFVTVAIIGVGGGGGGGGSGDSCGNLEGNLNSAFVDSELNLAGSLRKKAKKTTHWSDEVKERCATTMETAIDIERY